jgi:DoxX
MRKRGFHEKYNAMAYKTACRWPAIGALAPPDGRRRVLLGGSAKFVYANQGVGRFTKLGMPFPAFTADFVGCLEIVGGLLLLLGLLTRLIAIPFVIEMIVAMLSTKISMYLGKSPLPPTAGATSDRILGGFTRDSLRIRADHGRSLPAD